VSKLLSVRPGTLRTALEWLQVSKATKRHDGHFAQHPIFSFLIFNILLGSRNWWIAQGRLKQSAFGCVEGIHRRLTPARSAKGDRRSRQRKTTDEDVLELMGELSLYSSRGSEGAGGGGSKVNRNRKNAGASVKAGMGLLLGGLVVAPV
jgi:hypothetical protein